MAQVEGPVAPQVRGALGDPQDHGGGVDDHGLGGVQVLEGVAVAEPEVCVVDAASVTEQGHGVLGFEGARGREQLRESVVAVAARGRPPDPLVVGVGLEGLSHHVVGGPDGVLIVATDQAGLVGVGSRGGLEDDRLSLDTVADHDDPGGPELGGLDHGDGLLEGVGLLQDLAQDKGQGDGVGLAGVVGAGRVGRHEDASGVDAGDHADHAGPADRDEGVLAVGVVERDQAIGLEVGPKIDAQGPAQNQVTALDPGCARARGDGEHAALDNHVLEALREIEETLVEK